MVGLNKNRESKMISDTGTRKMKNITTAEITAVEYCLKPNNTCQVLCIKKIKLLKI
jgi:hypothetical protein